MQRLLHLPVLIGAGIAVGLARGAREVSRHNYLAEDLDRTALWVLSDRTRAGALIGFEAALMVLLLLLIPWGKVGAAAHRIVGAPSTATDERPSYAGAGALLAALLLLASLAVALWAPAKGARLLWVPYSALVVALFAVLWAIVLALATAAARLPASGQPEAWFRLRWLAVVGLAYILFALHTWAGPGPARRKLLVAAGALLAAIAVYWILRKPARLLEAGLRAAAAAARGAPLRGLVSAAAVLGSVLILAAAALWIAGWLIWRQASRDTAALGKNVIVVVVDTLRADRCSLLSADERPRDVTPNLREKLASRGAVFTNAVSQAPWTGPAIASMLTGLYPEQHRGDRLTAKLSLRQTTLPELLRERGYRTLGVVSGSLAASGFGLSQGYHHFDESLAVGGWDELTAVTSRRVTNAAIRMLERRGSDPFFLLAHYYDPHYNFRDHKQYDFADSYTGWLRDEIGIQEQMNMLRMKRHLLETPELDYLRARYDEEIAFTDTHIGRLLDYIGKSDLWQSTLVILVADHGEEFMEHGWIGHTITLHQELIHVPLIVASPTAPGRAVVDRPVETRWLFTTVLDFLGLDLPGGGPGRGPSLLRLSPEDEPLVRSSTRPLVDPKTRMARGGKRVWLSCVVGPRWKLVEDHMRDHVMMFDLASDPGEHIDLSTMEVSKKELLAQALEAWDAAVGRRTDSTEQPRVGEKHLERLKSLGYL